MNDSIRSTFDFLGGTIEAEISAKNSYITWYKDGETYVIDNSYGQVYDFDSYNFALLKGAAYESFCEKAAKDYAMEAFALWCIANAEAMQNV